VTAFVILAAGPGTRMGRTGGQLHKCLVPLAGKALISHQIALAPPGPVIVCTGSNAVQVEDYLALAHPDRDITCLYVPGWSAPGGGPGSSLLQAQDAVGDQDMIFTSCDTLWHEDDELWDTAFSWAATAPVPAGTEPQRWCRIETEGTGRQAVAIWDKVGTAGDAYTGLSMILARDLPAFWHGVETNGLLGTERQVTGGLKELISAGPLVTKRIAWTDVGDQDAYERAVAAWSGYDWVKTGEATYVLPGDGRVVKYQADAISLTRRVNRQESILHATPKLVDHRPHLFAYDYIPGITGYEAADKNRNIVAELLDWANIYLWNPAEAVAPAERCLAFYKGKTEQRIAMLREPLKTIATQAIARIDWNWLITGCIPVTFHGDFNLGNVIVKPGGGFMGIDWREDFAGETTWGDWRYDAGKLAAGMIVHWGRARHGDFRPWEEGQHHLDVMADWLGGQINTDIMIIAALSLISSAPLHAEPLDEVAVARAVALLEEIV